MTDKPECAACAANLAALEASRRSNALLLGALGYMLGRLEGDPDGTIPAWVSGIHADALGVPQA